MPTVFNFVPGTNVKPAGYQQVANAALAAATFLTPPVIDKVNAAIIQNDPLVSTSAVRWTDDGTVPTAAIGNVLNVGDSMEYTGDLSAIQFIRIAATAQLNVSYYKYGMSGE